MVGTRSAIFAPLENVGLIIVDEEQESSYKQEETPRYHGRDVAIVRAKSENAGAGSGSGIPVWRDRRVIRRVIADCNLASECPVVATEKVESIRRSPSPGVTEAGSGIHQRPNGRERYDGRSP